MAAAPSSEWAHGQASYESFFQRWIGGSRESFAAIDRDDRALYEQFDMSGDVLDVGGFPGILAAQLGLDRSRYVVADPMTLEWDEIADRAPVFADHYRLGDVQRVVAFAEDLPFADSSFDVVNMRSAIDHFADPAAALTEAHRVLRRGGRLVVGASLAGSRRRGITKDLVFATPIVCRLARIVRPDHHMFHPTRDELVALVEQAGFAIEREVWPPQYKGVLYIEARAAPISPRAQDR